MTSAIKSQLNPLAVTFIPTRLPFNLQEKNTKNETIVTRARIEKQNSNCKSKYEDSKSATMRLFPKTRTFSDLDFLSGITLLSFILKNAFVLELRLPLSKSLQPPILPDTSIKNRVECKKSVSLEETKAKSVVKESVECCCPPMFGWSVPPDFIGNPFNFKYECNKKYPHDPDSKEKPKIDIANSDQLDREINDLTLDECYSTMKDILIDVYETISTDSSTKIKCDDKRKIDNLEGSKNRSDKDEKPLSLPSTSEIRKEPALIDDGIHPLLQSVPTKEYDDKDLVKVEKILERSLSQPRPASFEAEAFCSEVTCDPPCSVWCEFLPPAARETFKKYIQKTGNAKVTKQLQSFGHKPVFKRSLSADDAPMYARFNRSSSQTSASEPRELLILRRKNPLGYFKVRSILMNRKMNQYRNLMDQLSGHSNVKSSMWGKFDSADSLWQPLPECIPINGYMKTNIGHETRLQRTLT